MTPDELEALVDAATPGPWYGNGLNRVLTRETGVGTVAVASYDPDAPLIALAPQLARDHARLLRWAEKAALILEDDVLLKVPHEGFARESMKSRRALLREYAELKEDKT